MPDWEQRKSEGKGGEFGGGLPQAVYTEGGVEHKLAQFSAIMRTFGIRFGYYDAGDWKQAMYVDPIMDTWGDIADSLSKVAFSEDPEEPKANFAKIAGKFHGLVEANLKQHGGKFCAGDSVTIADFVLASYVGNILLNPASVAGDSPKSQLSSTPKFEAYTQLVMEEFPHLKSRPTPGPM